LHRRAATFAQERLLPCADVELMRHFVLPFYLSTDVHKAPSTAAKLERGARHSSAGFRRDCRTGSELLKTCSPPDRCRKMKPFARIRSRTKSLPVDDVASEGRYLAAAARTIVRRPDSHVEKATELVANLHKLVATTSALLVDLLDDLYAVALSWWLKAPLC
jgi:hypothetical protein